MTMTGMFTLRVWVAAATLSAACPPAISTAFAQAEPTGPPVVGIIAARKEPITQTEQFIGRIEAKQRVDIVARVTAFIEKRLFVEGTDVEEGALLYLLEQGPFQAVVAAQKAQIAQVEAQLENARLTTQRARTLLGGPAGQQSTYDAALANERALEAQLQGAQAQLDTAQINLGYTEIRAPIAGQIGRTSLTIGNVVGPGSGVLTTIISQDPMFVTFPVPVREAINLRARYGPTGGFGAVLIRAQLPDGRFYDHTGTLDFVNNTIATNTDTILLRGVLPNPPIFGQTRSLLTLRELTDGEFVTVFLEGVEPVEVVAIPRAAVLADQRGSYVYVIGPGNKAEERRIQLGQSSTTLAAVTSGLKVGEQVIAEGLQRVRAGETVSPKPADAILQRMMRNSAVNADRAGPAASVSPPAGQAPTGAASGAGPSASGSPSRRR
ncbi:efflux RND transporter periplasmic adaptor subunit [Methylorubrum extorquens]|uniref:efflux RND transporter periplasmic adaptor subunit n=1 Tax=Methylorubrum extorquens TaxID=408 RepID=UPI0020A04777|nr:efflux RND transporter periplasmic adaptor subunit [Methylorubrum extorquens]MCP1538258.1 membrane fusion protein (multidrug efflux system) [Methylorubrum extorquens]